MVGGNSNHKGNPTITPQLVRMESLPSSTLCKIYPYLGIFHHLWVELQAREDKYARLWQLATHAWQTV